MKLLLISTLQKHFTTHTIIYSILENTAIKLYIFIIYNIYILYHTTSTGNGEGKRTVSGSKMRI